MLNNVILKKININFTFLNLVNIKNLKLRLKKRGKLNRYDTFNDNFYTRVQKGFVKLGLELFSGDGGFYHWCKLPGTLTAEKLNEKLFQKGAAILKGTDCDMHRLGIDSHLKHFFRFSFGPLLPNSFDSDIEIFFNDKVANGKSIINIMTMAAPQNGEITVKVNGVDEEMLIKELSEWHVEAHKSKEDFDNFPDKHELLKAFEII